MATDERNFRSAYYEKVGFKSVEEKKSLEILLKEKILDKAKLRQFSLRFSVPAIYRNLLWKVLLGVLPVHVDCHNFIMKERKQEYKDILHALQVMKTIDNVTPKCQVFLAVWSLQTGNLYYFTNGMLKDKGFSDMVQSLMQLFEDDTDIYWLAKALHDNIGKFESDFPKLLEITHNLLEKEDPILYKHLKSSGILDSLPIEEWFHSCLAGLLNETSLAKIWDKLCGGSCKILVYAVIALLTNLKHNLLKCNNLKEALQCVKNIPEDTADVIANIAIDMWQQNGSYLTVHDKPKP